MNQPPECEQIDKNREQKENSPWILASGGDQPGRPWRLTLANAYRRWRGTETENVWQKNGMNPKKHAKRFEGPLDVTVRQGIPSRGGYAALHWDWNCDERPFTSIYIHLHQSTSIYIHLNPFAIFQVLNVGFRGTRGLQGNRPRHRSFIDTKQQVWFGVEIWNQQG